MVTAGAVAQADTSISNKDGKRPDNSDEDLSGLMTLNLKFKVQEIKLSHTRSQGFLALFPMDFRFPLGSFACFALKLPLLQEHGLF